MKENENNQKVLIPLLSKKENNLAFLEQATKNAKEIILLLIIDKRELFGQFGFAASEIMQGTHLLEELQNKLKENGKHATDIQEWGETETKIEHIAMLQQVDKVFLLEQENEYFKNLVKQLKKTLGNKIEIIKVQEQVPAQEQQKKNSLKIGNA